MRLPTIATGTGGGAGRCGGAVMPPVEVGGGAVLPPVPRGGAWPDADVPDVSVARISTCSRSPVARTSRVTWLPGARLAVVASLITPLSVATTSNPSGSRPCTVPRRIVPLSNCVRWRGGSGTTAVNTLAAAPAVGNRGGRLTENSLIRGLRQTLRNDADVARSLTVGCRIKSAVWVRIASRTLVSRRTTPISGGVIFRNVSQAFAKVL